MLSTCTPVLPGDVTIHFEQKQIRLDESLKAKHSGVIACSNVARLREGGWWSQQDTSDPGAVTAAIELRRKGPAGKTLRLKMDPVALFWLTAFFRQECPGTLPVAK